MVATPSAEFDGESWSDLQDVHSPAFLAYLDFESSASMIRSYQPVAVPGLLQTRDYALAIQRHMLGVSDEVAERRWDGRQRRLKLHERDKPPKLLFVVDESVVRRSVGGPDVTQQQLERLIEWTREPHISLRVVPFDAGLYPGIGLPFVLLEFQDESHEDVLFLEHETARTIQDSPREADPYRVRFFELEKVALSVDDSRTQIEQAIN